jgi:hypothetical protein
MAQSSPVSLLPFPYRREPENRPVPRGQQGLIAKLCGHMVKSAGALTPTGRDAIASIFQDLGLNRHDEVWVVTTFDYPNVSSCVTCTIFNVCKPSRVLTARTRAILVIHEFGVPHPDTPALLKLAREREIPLIEDCAHTVDSCGEGWQVGTIGDFVILSFPKLFPTQQGGALLGTSALPPSLEGNSVQLAGAFRTVEREWETLREQSARRRAIYRDLTRRVEQLGAAPLFRVTDRITPRCFPLPSSRWRKLLEVAREHQVECGLWHGTNIVIFPCHHFLRTEDIDRIEGVMKAA